MANYLFFWGCFLIFRYNSYFNTHAIEENNIEFMSKEERENLKEEARDMFYHAYNAYMANAYPADELMPLSCKGRYRGSEPNRGDIDSTLGNFSLTLVDTLDTLVVLGDFEEFENAVKLVIKDVTFDTDVIVSLFETNIRMLGGLLSGHILAEYLQQRADIMPWYRGELLNLAKDLGYRFLPAFNTTTGIPYGRINLKYGMKGVPLEVSRETCTACAGSMILEMAALSRLTGESIFENKAQKAMDVLWRMRHRGTDLMGSVLNVHSGDWVRRDSGVGAGIDSYYEYCLKAYILLGDEKYLGRFNRHYQAVMKYVSQGPMLLDVHMHRPNTNAKNFMDALLAFWPGLQVLKGDIKPAVETHEMLYQVMQRHNFIPEAFTTDFQVHWGHHPLRPEFLESTYFLYRATGDHYYLGVGRKVLKSLQKYARVTCGYAAVSDVRTNKHDDTMDSFVLSETLKYLFLLFAEPNELVLDLDEFIFTTEGHLLPLTLASVRTNVSSDFERDTVEVDEMDRTCPNSLHLFPASVRQPLRNMVEDVCPRRNFKRRLSASQFQANNIDHLKMLSDMGITILTLADGRVQFLHTFSNAKSTHDAEEGLLFMQEMIELSKYQSQQIETKPQSIVFTKPGTEPPEDVTLLAGPAQFGPELRGNNKLIGKVVLAHPLNACTDIIDANQIEGKIVIVLRGTCMFIEKARRIQKAGALAGIVLDNAPGSSANTSPMFAMSGDGKDVDDVKIPFIFLFTAEANQLLEAIKEYHKIFVTDFLTLTIGDFQRKDDILLKSPTEQSIFERLKGSLNEIFNRQLMSQNSLIGGVPSTTELKQNRDTELYEIPIADFANLQAFPSKNLILYQICIKAKSGVAAAITSKKFDEKNSQNENEWRQMRQIIVNSIYSNEHINTGVSLDFALITYYFKILMLERGETHETINKSNIIGRVAWLLKELSELEPNITKSNKFVDDENVPMNLFQLKTTTTTTAETNENLSSDFDKLLDILKRLSEIQKLPENDPENEILPGKIVEIRKLPQNSLENENMPGKIVENQENQKLSENDPENEILPGKIVEKQKIPQNSLENENLPGKIVENQENQKLPENDPENEILPGKIVEIRKLPQNSLENENLPGKIVENQGKEESFQNSWENEENPKLPRIALENEILPGKIVENRNSPKNILNDQENLKLSGKFQENEILPGKIVENQEKQNAPQNILNDQENSKLSGKISENEILTKNTLNNRKNPKLPENSWENENQKLSEKTMEMQENEKLPENFPDNQQNVNIMDIMNDNNVIKKIDIKLLENLGQNIDEKTRKILYENLENLNKVITTTNDVLKMNDMIQFLHNSEKLLNQVKYEKLKENLNFNLPEKDGEGDNKRYIDEL